MIEIIPQTAWIRVLSYLGFFGSCQLRKISKSIRDRVDKDIFWIYKQLEGKKDTELSNYLNHPIIYPKLLLTKVDTDVHNFRNIGITYEMMMYSNLFDIIDSKNLFNNIMHRVQLYQLKNTKLMKAIKLVMTGLSDHYTLLCMPLSNERIDWAISFTSTGLSDIFCYRGASEFNESQKNNLLKIKEYSHQDCYAFEAAERLTDGQIDIMIEKKKENRLDYYSLTAAAEIDV